MIDTLFTAALTPPAATGMQVGIDVVRISEIAASLARFGERFLRRIYTAAEVSYAQSGTSVVERLSARFAAKEAALKALDFCHAGVNLRDIEVVRDRAGACSLVLHGRAAELASALGPHDISLSLTHEGDYAIAAVTVLLKPAPDAAAPGWLH